MNYGTDDFRVSYGASYISSTGENTDFDAASLSYKSSGKLDAWLTHDLTATYFTDYGDVSLAIRNLTNEDPILDSDGNWADDQLYDNLGRVTTLTYKVEF